MPLVVACPGCPAKLSAPESAAGKQIRCPKCGATATVPAFVPAEEVPVVDAAVVAPAPKPKRVLAEEDESAVRPRKTARRDDDEDEDDERPRKKKRPRYADDDDDYEHDHPRRRRRSGGGGGVAVIVTVVVGVLVLGGVGAGIYLLRGPGFSFARKAPIPPGWKQYNYPEDGLKFYTPLAPAWQKVPVGAQPRNRWGGAPFDARNDIQDVESVAAYSAGALNDSVHIELVVIRFRSRVPATIRDQLRDRAAAELKGAQWRTVRWLGFDAEEATTQTNKVRAVCTDRTVLVASIGSGNGTRAKPEEEDGFFDNVELTK